MNWNLPLFVLVAVLTISLLPSEGSSQQCASMVGTPLQRCNVAGYNSTFTIPYKMSNKTKFWVSFFLDYAIRMTESNNCSISLQRMGEMIVCAIYVPRCRKGDLFLPCKRVCVEYFKKCDGHVDPFWFDYFIAHCQMLPDYKASSGKCFEPANFDQKFNDTGADILKGKCNKLIFPWCKNMGYKYTIMKESTQIETYWYLYGKNFTNTSSDNYYSNISGINYWTEFMKNHSDCATDIKKMLCADLFPPCYPHEGTELYGICHETCRDMRNRCPAIAQHSTNLGNFLSTCESLASDNPSNGYCKRTSWPKPLLWLTYFKDYVDPKPKKTPSSTTIPVYVIVISVVIPLALICIVAAVFLLWRQRKLPWFVRKFKRGEDTKDIVEDENPEFPEIPKENTKA